jgi:two-component sensor histidine kinase
MAARTAPDAVALSLALAVIDSSNAPILLLDEGFAVVAASASFYAAFGLRPQDTAGHPLFGLGAGEWDIPQLRSLLTASSNESAGIDAYEMDLARAGHATRRLVLSARKLDYAPQAPARFILTVSDVTDARASAKMNLDLIEEKAVLLRELHHRVANSLQIIASVLLQSARRVTSEESRGHLTNAHSRVMSLATLQRQLSAADVSDVKLRTYFTQLCQSLGASMIHDPNQIVIEVNVDDSSLSGDDSVSLGLIVTELVINALKHAFPGERKGRIIVSYQSQGPNWTLAVGDNGVGMPQNSAGGLGTSIIEALSKRLGARIRISDTKPGTTVSIVHAAVAAIATQAKPAASRGPFMDRTL